MNEIVNDPVVRLGGSGPGWDDASEEDLQFRPLSREEAQDLRRRMSFLSPWVVLGWQGLVGVVCCAAFGVFSQRSSVAWSSLYGVVAVVLPGMLLARGMTKQARSPMASAAGFMFWEMLKIGVAIAMLVIAARVVPNLSWPAMLVTMVVCMKVNWFALLWRGR
jgi:ATP synthase protein I